jgi:hypothetical protein
VGTLDAGPPWRKRGVSAPVCGPPDTHARSPVPHPRPIYRPARGSRPEPIFRPRSTLAWAAKDRWGACGVRGGRKIGPATHCHTSPCVDTQDYRLYHSPQALRHNRCVLVQGPTPLGAGDHSTEGLHGHEEEDREEDHQEVGRPEEEDGGEEGRSAQDGPEVGLPQEGGCCSRPDGLARSRRASETFWIPVNGSADSAEPFRFLGAPGRMSAR